VSLPACPAGSKISQPVTQGHGDAST